MAEVWYGHFDNTDPENPRMLRAIDLARYFMAFLTNGVRSFGSCLRVDAGGDMSVNVNVGEAHINGHMFGIYPDLAGNFVNLTIPAADPSHTRVDRVVLRMSLFPEINGIIPMVLVGTPAVNAQPPPLIRDEVTYDLSLARVTAPAGTLAISAANIADERTNTELCGQLNSHLGLDPSESFPPLTRGGKPFIALTGQSAPCCRDSLMEWQKQFDAFMAALTVAFNDRKATWDALLSALPGQAQSVISQVISQNQARFDVWFTSIQNQSAAELGLFFDFLSQQSGMTNAITKPAARQILETVKITATNQTMATRLTTRQSGTVIIERVVIYDGATALLDKTKTTTKNADGTITEVVT